MSLLVYHRFHRIRLLAPAYFLGLLLVLPLFQGCSPGETVELLSETEERGFQRGKQLLREGRRPEALTAFLSVIDKRRGDAAESHLEAGEIYRTHFKNPIYAIYHYRKFLEISPHSVQAPHVRQLIDTATKDFAASLPAQPMQAQYERLELLETVERLQKENEDLKRQLTAAREERARPAPPPPVAQAARQPAARQVAASPSTSSGRTYTVAPGDTLTHISGKVYGTNARWKDIFEANRDVMANENSLRIGMTLRIPE